MHLHITQVFIHMKPLTNFNLEVTTCTSKYLWCKAAENICAPWQ
jgi:hypothetical protein